MRGFLKHVPGSAHPRIPVLAVCLSMTLMLPFFTVRGRAIQIEALTVKADFEGKTIRPDQQIELMLSREVSSTEGRVAIVVGTIDLTSLFIASGPRLTYTPRPLPFAAGETVLTVYLVDPQNEWNEVARFELKVSTSGEVDATTLASTPAEGSETAQQIEERPVNGSPAEAIPSTTEAQAPAEPVKRRFGFDKFELTPQLNIGFKSQFAEAHFPDANQPQRPTFIDATLSGTWKSEMSRGPMKMEQQFDIVGSSFRDEALRFAEQGQDARKIEMSSYLMQFQQETRKFNLGHSAFGNQRHLINNFNSRGMSFVLPITKRLDFSLAAMNSTNIAGFDNFLGVANRRHRLYGGILGVEILEERPGGLRFETGVTDAWFLSARQNFNEANINDSERSRGFSFRVLAKDKSERARLDAGFTRSQFFNPNDPLLNQNAENVVQTNTTTRSARYAEAGFDLLKAVTFRSKRPVPAADSVATTDAASQAGTAQLAQPVGDLKTFSLTLNLRHERVDPLFRSIAAAAQADLQQNNVEFVGAFGELAFTAAHTQFNDNLAGIRTILRTNTHRTTAAVTTPLLGLFSTRAPVTPNPFLPRVGYTFERTRAAADFVPIGGGFDQPGAIPDQANINQSFTSEWQFKEIRLAYRLNHTLLDNRARGREVNDQQNFVHNVTVGWNPMTTLELNLDVNFEDSNNREQANSDRNLRFGIIANWQATKRQNINATFSTIGAGDLRRTNESRNVEFDLQWNYRIVRENENRFRKLQMVYFVRYSNRFARARNFIENVNNLTRLNTFNTGLNFIFF